MSITSRLQTRFNDPAAAVTVDTSDLHSLVAMLALAERSAPIKADQALDIIVPAVHAEASAIVATYDKASTGELLANISHDTSGMVRRVYSTVKQGALLEYGTPTTGAPRPWLTGPAERGSVKLLASMASVGRIW